MVLTTDVVCSNSDQSLRDLENPSGPPAGGMFNPFTKNPPASSSGGRQVRRGSLREAQRDPGSITASVSSSKSFAGTRDKATSFGSSRSEVPNECLYDSAGGMFQRHVDCTVKHLILTKFVYRLRILHCPLPLPISFCAWGCLIPLHDIMFLDNA